MNCADRILIELKRRADKDHKGIMPLVSMTTRTGTSCIDAEIVRHNHGEGYVEIREIKRAFAEIMEKKQPELPTIFIVTAEIAVVVPTWR